MKNKFTIGSKVEVIDGVTKGIVIGITDKGAFVKTQDGMEIEFQEQDLVILKDEINVDWREYNQFKKIEIKHKPNKKLEKSKIGNTTVWKIDLHIEKLLEPKKRKSVIALEYQLSHAEYILKTAIQKGIQNIVFIHGVGEGILRAELETIVSRYPEAKWQDADYKEYGMGAMHIYIKQSLRSL